MMLAHTVTADQAWGAWAPDPGELATLVVVAILYAHGVRRLAGRGAGRVVRRRQVVAFGAGLCALAAALLSPLDPLADTLFSWHMVQHLSLTLVAAPLIVYGRPLVVIGLALPRRIRLAGHRITSAGALAPAAGALRHPVSAWGLYAVALWGWHLPGPYQAAVHDAALHALEHLSFLGAALAFWSVVIGAGPRRRVSYGAALILVFTTMVHNAWLAMILTVSPAAAYPVYGRGAETWGLTLQADQQIGGVIMWVPSAVVFAVVLAVLFLRWFRELEERMPPPTTSPYGSHPVRTGEGR